jgi:hypothetical protein
MDTYRLTGKPVAVLQGPQHGTRVEPARHRSEPQHKLNFDVNEERVAASYTYNNEINVTVQIDTQLIRRLLLP